MLTLPSFLTPLESAVIAAMLAASTEFGETLSIQLAQSQLESRRHNGYGFFTTFAVSNESPLTTLVDERLAASALVGGELCGFLLWIKNGRIDFLEGYPLGGDAWPSDQTIEQISLNK